MDSVFSALGHADRRRILDILRSRPGSSVNDVCAYFQTSRIAVMKHLRVLEAANLVHSDKQGRVRMLYFNSVPIQMIYDRWTTELSAYWSAGVTALKYRAEARAERERKPKRGQRA